MWYHIYNLFHCVPLVDGSIVNNSAELNFTYVTNLRDLDFPRYQYEESTLRIRATVIARSSAHAGMVDGQIYWIEVGSASLVSSHYLKWF